MVSNKPILVSAGMDGALRFWDVATQKNYLALNYLVNKENDSQINALCITPDGTQLAAAAWQTIRVFSLQDPKPQGLHTFNVHEQKNVTAVGFEADGRWMFTAGEDGTAKIWDMRITQLNCQRIFQVKTAVQSVAIHPNQTELIISDSSGALYVWDLRTDIDDSLVTDVDVSEYIVHVDVDRMGRQCSAVTNRGHLFMWNIDRVDSLGSNVTTIAQQHAQSYAGDFHGDTSNKAEKRSNLTEENDGHEEDENEDDEEEDEEEANSSTQPNTNAPNRTDPNVSGEEQNDANEDDSQRAPATATMTTICCSPGSMPPLASPPPVPSAGVDAHFNTAAAAALAYRDAVANPHYRHQQHLLQQTTNPQQQQPKQHYEPPQHHPNPQPQRQRANINNFGQPQHFGGSPMPPTMGSSNCSQLKSPVKIRAHKTFALKCRFRPDGLVLATTSADQSAKSWSVTNHKLLNTYTKPGCKWVWDCAFTNDSRYMITGSSDGVLRMWEMDTGEIVRTFFGHSLGITAMAFRDAA